MPTILPTLLQVGVVGMFFFVTLLFIRIALEFSPAAAAAFGTKGISF